MRLALHATAEVGRRAGRILLAEAGLEALGIYGPRRAETEDRRCTAISDLSGYGVLLTDDAVAPADLATLAAEDGLDCVLAADCTPELALAARFEAAGRALLAGAALPALAEALAAHQAARSTPATEILVAWTTPGRPLHRGSAIPFPDPVGPRWGKRLPHRAGEGPATTRVVVPLDGPWGAALARVDKRHRGRRRRHLVAVADDRAHLEAIALAAGALAVAEGACPPGVHRPGEIAPAYLAIALRLGLEVAGVEVGP